MVGWVLGFWISSGSWLAASGEVRASSPDLKSIQDSLARISAQVTKNRWGEALASTRQLEARLSQRAKLKIVDAQILVAPAEGLGIYTPSAEGMVRGGELFLYAQVVNHQSREVAGYHEIFLVSDLVILDRNGTELARDDGFGKSRFTARAPHRDTFVNIAVRTKGLATGSYRARLVVHDRIGKKSGRVEVDFRIP